MFSITFKNHFTEDEVLKYNDVKINLYSTFIEQHNTIFICFTSFSIHHYSKLSQDENMKSEQDQKTEKKKDK